MLERVKPAVGRRLLAGRTLLPDLKHIICLDLLPKLFKSPHVISHNKLLY